MADELTFEEMYADLVEASTRALPPNYFSTQRYAEDTGMPERSARRELLALVEARKLETKLAVVDGHKARVYWFVGDE